MIYYIQQLRRAYDSEPKWTTLEFLGTFDSLPEAKLKVAKENTKDQPVSHPCRIIGVTEAHYPPSGDGWIKEELS